MRFWYLYLISYSLFAVELGIDRLFDDEIYSRIKKKRIGLVTNHTGVDSNLRSSIEIVREKMKLVALFSPEHGLSGSYYAGEEVKSKKKKLPIYSLHGETRRPTKQMLKGIDVILFDIQDIGVRGYTYISTLFYVMEEAAKYGIEVVILDRPNPLSGEVIDGAQLEKKWRSFVGYIDVPYCHGMTVGELAHYFNVEYEVGCKISIVKMKGWDRKMSFAHTGLPWIPTSPNVPEKETPYYAATTGVIGELSLVNIGIGYTLPFKIVGAPWINGEVFARHLNNQKLAGVKFVPFSFRPFFGLYKGEECQGVLIVVLDYLEYKPQAAQYLLMGILKSLYPKEITGRLSGMDKGKKELFCKVCGTEKVLSSLENEKVFAWKLIEASQRDVNQFKKKRQPYLIKEYSSTH